MADLSVEAREIIVSCSFSYVTAEYESVSLHRHVLYSTHCKARTGLHNCLPSSTPHSQESKSLRSCMKAHAGRKAKGKALSSITSSLALARFSALLLEGVPLSGGNSLGEPEQQQCVILWRALGVPGLHANLMKRACDSTSRAQHLSCSRCLLNTPYRLRKAPLEGRSSDGQH